MKTGDQLSSIFDRYQCTGEDAGLIAEDKLESYFKDLGLADKPHVKYVLCHKIQAQDPGEISKETFENGWRNLRVRNFNEMKRKCREWTNNFTRNTVFAPVYMWAFDYLKESDESKYLTRDDAMEVWEALFPLKWQLWPNFKTFFEGLEQKVVTTDQWDNIWHFARDARPDGSNWDDIDDGSWSTLIDEFVESLQDEGIWPSG